MFVYPRVFKRAAKDLMLLANRLPGGTIYTVEFEDADSGEKYKLTLQKFKDSPARAGGE